MSVDFREADALAEGRPDDRGTASPIAPCGSSERNQPEFKSGHGGARTGAGRKPKPLTHQSPPALLRWHCVRTEHGEDTTAAIEIGQAGFRVLTLSLWKPPRAARRDSVSGTARPASPSRVVPLFPGYLLTQFCSADPDWRRINGLPGVDRVLAATSPSGPAPYTISDAAIEHILRLPGMDRTTGCVFPAGWSAAGPSPSPLDRGSSFRLDQDTPIGAGEDHICDWSDSKRVRFLGSLFGRDNVPITTSRRHVNQV